MSREDIIVTKIGRYSDKDKEDIKELIKKSDKVKINQLIDCVEQRRNISKKVKEHFLSNVEKFRRDFDV